jgi:hypothetical protein
VAQLISLWLDEVDGSLWGRNALKERLTAQKMLDKLGQRVSQFKCLEAANTIFAIAIQASYDVLNLYLRERNLFDRIAPRHKLLPLLASIHPETSKITAQMLADARLGTKTDDAYASVLAVELIRVTRTRLEKETDPEKRWQIICEALPKLSQLRCDGHRAVRTFIKRDRWNREREREEEEELERLEKENKKHLIDICFSPMLNQTTAECFGGGEYGKKMAELIHRIKFDLPYEDLLATLSFGKTHPNGIKPNPTESDLIQPNPTNFSNGHTPSANHHDE